MNVPLNGIKGRYCLIFNHIMQTNKLKKTIRKFKCFAAFALLTMITHAVYAQQNTSVKGTVVDEKGATLPGVSVMMVDQTTKKQESTVTDLKGIFVFNNVKIGNRYDFSFNYVGYEKKTSPAFLINPGTNNSILIRMETSSSGLNDVVVVGYGSQRKTKITGAISQVKSEELNKYAGSNFAQQLAGKAAGVVINDASAQPGTDPQIVIRGIGTLTAGVSPLVVVDGFPLSEGSSLNTVNPQDIETIDILKDPASAAIYGSRAANGVILITTKNGRSDKNTVSFDFYTGAQVRADKVDLVDGYQFAQLNTEARDWGYVSRNPTNRSISDDYATRVSKGANKRDLRLNYIQPYLNNQPGLTNTDWLDEIFRTAPISSYNVAVSGGNDKSKYYFSGNYFDQDGIVIETGLKRYSMSFKFDSKLSKSFDIGLSINPSYNRQNFFQNDASRSSDAIGAALIMYPFFPARNNDGSLAISQQITANTPEDGALGENPVAIMEKTKYNKNLFRTFGNAYLNFKPVAGLTFKSLLGGDYSNSFIDFFTPSDVGEYRTAAPKPARASETNGSVINYLWENTLTFEKTFGKHDINVLAGTTFQKESGNNTLVSGTGIPDNNIDNIAGASSFSVVPQRYIWTQLSYLTRLQYAYANKYLFSAAIRRDGSSRFGQDAKWGNFPSVTGGWIVSREDFFPKVNWIDLLKFRATYGKAGNNQIGNYSSYALANPLSYVSGSTLLPGFAAVNPANSTLSWETKTSYNFGMDLGLFKVLNLSANYYSMVTSDLLLQVPVPSQSGYDSALQNVGRASNKGLELELSGTNIKLGPLNWNFGANIASNKNKVLELGPGQNQIVTGTNSAFRTKVGGPIAELYGYNVTGLYKNQSEIDNSPHVAGTLLGDYIVQDVNGDGKITPDDRMGFGTYAPKITYGFNSSLAYKSFELSFSINGIWGRKIYDNGLVNMESGEGFSMADTYYYENRYHPVNNPNGFLAQPNTNYSANRLNTNASNIFFQKADYIRLRNVQLTYNLSSKLLSKLKVSRASVYVTGNNLLTVTNFRGFNPDATSDNVLTSGYSNSNYPVARSFVAGFNLTF
ncbi:TonB-linked SusC/RagA family outer membrane protein [Pedobacter alluvionis]|uniref:TonB-dependent receptor n=2 Tax=Pedobacter alluvionis TaxID=475253 RepID=A0A497XL79_9SPHI|nr:TonB-linked SusC/RagA family outer membrane protein [Pedobacter alluvionis]TFB28434.1 TonB-dependent receptor [Pedobacter alluvionis]